MKGTATQQAAHNPAATHRGGGGSSAVQHDNNNNTTSSSTNNAFPKAPAAPERSRFQNQIQTKRDELIALRTRLVAIQDKLSNRIVDPEREAFYEEQKKLTQRMQDIQATIRAEREKRTCVTKSMRDARALREELEEKVRALTGELGTFKTIDEIDMALDHITTRMETSGTGSLKEEKEYIRRRKLLEAAKDQVAQLRPLQEHIDKCSDKELDSLKDAKKLQERLDELNAKLKEIMHEKATAVMPNNAREEIAALKAEREDIRKCMTKTREDMDHIRIAQKVEEDAYQKKREAWRLQIEAIKKEREEQRKAREEERAKKELQLRALQRLNPYEKESDMCTALIQYLKEKTGKSSMPVIPRRVARPVAVTPYVDPNMLLPKHDDELENDWLFQDRRKKKTGTSSSSSSNTTTKGQNTKSNNNNNTNNNAAKADSTPVAVAQSGTHNNNTTTTSGAASKENTSLKHEIHRLVSFDRVGIKAPMTVGDIAATIELLTQKKAYYNTFILTEEEAQAKELEEMAAAKAKQQEQSKKDKTTTSGEKGKDVVASPAAEESSN